MSGISRVGSSFRDPSGFLYRRDGVLLRQVHARYEPHYARLMGGGLYDALQSEGLLIPHDEVERSAAATDEAVRVLRPAPIPFVSMPYEWGFGQRRAAALLTLRVQELALAHGMTLKDASAYNVQFQGVRPVLIDTLSFEIREDGAPWTAYRQFCQHFLGPLALQARVDIRLGLLLRQFVDGIPLDLVSHLMPLSSRFSFWALLHIHMHARSIARYAATNGGTLVARDPRAARVSAHGLAGLIGNLQSAVRGLAWRPAHTEWGTYEETLGYDPTDRDAKHALVGDLVRRSAAGRVLDLGANAGEYSRVARDAGASTVIALDGDPVAVERAFQRLEAAGEGNVHPLWVDLTNPSPSQGWDHGEWPSLAERGAFDVVLALALVHHLAIGNNVPLPSVARMLARLGRQVIIEWVPKQDPQVQRLLRAREDIFVRYTEEEFRASFGATMRELHRAPIGASGRVLYLFTS